MDKAKNEGGPIREAPTEILKRKVGQHRDFMFKK